MIALLLLLGCGGTPALTEQRDFSVDCVGLNPSILLGFSAWSSVLSMDPRTGKSLERCVLIGHEQLTGEPTRVISGNETSVLISDPTAEPWLNFSVVASGRTWISRSGEAIFDAGFAQEKAAGSYTFEAEAKDLETGEETGETATLTGRFDWCASTQDDCPYPAGAGLDHGFELSTPGVVATGKLAACRAIVDEDLGTFRLDLAVGVWNGRNVGSLWVNECSQRGAILPLPNVLSFTSGGVYGDGIWSDLPVTRFAVVDDNPAYVWAEVRAAELSFKHPATMGTPPLNEEMACQAYIKTSHLSLNSGTCQVEIDQAAEHVVIDCTNTLHNNLDGVGAWASGPTHLEVDCTFQPWPG